MNQLDAGRVAFEIVGVERQEPGHAVDVHRGHDTGIMSGSAMYLMRNHEPFPLGIDGIVFGKDVKEPLDSSDPLGGKIR